jgi:hypothetical protein
MFRRNILSVCTFTVALKAEAMCSSETFVSRPIYRSSRRDNPAENLRSQASRILLKTCRSLLCVPHTCTPVVWLHDWTRQNKRNEGLTLSQGQPVSLCRHAPACLLNTNEWRVLWHVYAPYKVTSHYFLSPECEWRSVMRLGCVNLLQFLACIVFYELGI